MLLCVYGYQFHDPAQKTWKRLGGCKVITILGQPGGRMRQNLIFAFVCKTGAMCPLSHFLSVSHLCYHALARWITAAGQVS